MSLDERLASCVGFDWDEGNLVKNWRKHKVTAAECEQIFFNEPLLAGTDDIYSREEARYCALGHTDAGRLLFVAFTIRNNLIRVISARAMSRNEREVYEES